MKRRSLEQLLLDGHRQLDTIGNKPDKVRAAVTMLLARLNGKGATE